MHVMEPRVSIITLGVVDLERSYQFYHAGLGFPTTRKPADGIIYLQTKGVCLALYSLADLADDVTPGLRKERGQFSGITLSHITRTKEEVDDVLLRAQRAGGRIVKQARRSSTVSYSGYFCDPDGYAWEVSWARDWKFHDDGSLVVP